MKKLYDVHFFDYSIVIVVNVYQFNILIIKTIIDYFHTVLVILLKKEIIINLSSMLAINYWFKVKFINEILKRFILIIIAIADD